MKQIRLLLIFALVATAMGLRQQDQTVITVPAQNPQNEVIVNPEPLPSPVRILTPGPGQTLTANYVQLRYELIRPAATGEPNFLVQLDAHDPVNTSETSYTFPDVEPGQHTIQVTLVDANNIPVEGSPATVQFKIESQQPAQNGGPGAMQHPNRAITAARATGAIGAPPAAPIPPELRNDGDPNLPLAGSPLPMLSLIGFGLLLGGAVQAMRMRKN